MTVATTRKTGRPAQAIRIQPARLKRYFEAKLAAEMGPHNVKRLIDSGDRNFVILDVRTAEGFRQGHVPGAINIPFEELPTRLKELPKEKDIISYCWDATCILCTKAAYVLASKGFKAREMLGGMAAWQEAGFLVER